MSSFDDQQYMRAALSMARRGLGRVAPNPSVGCVIVNKGVIVGRGRTSEGGRPHAEAAALAQAGGAARGGTAYVTLEPCAVEGRGAPCAGALVEAGIKRVVIACIDPNPLVNGRGIEIMEEAGLSVEQGILTDQSVRMNKGFHLKITENRPMVTLKLAISADHKIASEKGARTKISGDLAMRHMHLVRSKYDAILVGSETALVDKPLLTTRIKGYTHEPLRLVMDRRGRIKDSDLHVMKDGDIPSALMHLAKDHGITRLLVEGGAQIHQSFLTSGFVDQFLLVKSSIMLGEEGVSAPYASELKGKYSLKLKKVRDLDEDTLETYEKEA